MTGAVVTCEAARPGTVGGDVIAAGSRLRPHVDLRTRRGAKSPLADGTQQSHGKQVAQ
jgi:hypothetical protein